MADDSVIVKFGGSIEGLTAAVDQARASIDSLAELFTGPQSAVGGIGEAFAADLAAGKIKGFAESTAELGTQTSRASEMLGVSTEEIGVCGIRRLAAAPGGAGRNCSWPAGN